MIISTNIYSGNDGISFARKIVRLQNLDVPFDVSIVKGIDGEDVINLSWNQTTYEERLFESEMEWG